MGIPTPMQFIPMLSHFDSQHCDLFPSHSHDSIPIHSQFVCREEIDAKHCKTRIMQFRTQIYEELKQVR